MCDSHGNPLQRCMICLEHLLGASERGQLPCGHNQFCYSCLETWSRTTNKCPLCAVRYHSLKLVTVSEEGEAKAKGEIEVPDKNFEEEVDVELLRMLEQVRCQVCGSDRDEHILMLCDYCDAGYHTSCLGMDCIPNLDVWYCDRCLPMLDRKEVDLQWQQMEQVGRRRVQRHGRREDRQTSTLSSRRPEPKRKRLRKLGTQS